MFPLLVHLASPCSHPTTQVSEPYPHVGVPTKAGPRGPAATKSEIGLSRSSWQSPWEMESAQESGDLRWLLGSPENLLPLETESRVPSQPPRCSPILFFSQAVEGKGLNPIELML